MQKKAEGEATTITTKENVIKNTFRKILEFFLKFGFFKRPVFRYRLKT